VDTPINTIKTAATGVASEFDRLNKPNPIGIGIVGTNLTAPTLSTNAPIDKLETIVVIENRKYKLPHTNSDHPFSCVRCT